MKYWKGKAGTAKQGQLGTYDAVPAPDSYEVTKADYDAWVAAQPVPTDPKVEYSALLTDAERIQYIAKKIGLLP